MKIAPNWSGIAAIVVGALAGIALATGQNGLSGVLGGIVLPQAQGRPGRAVSLFSLDGQTLFVGQPSPVLASMYRSAAQNIASGGPDPV